MHRFRIKASMIAVLALIGVSGPLVTSASAGGKTLQIALESLKAGGKTMVGPGTYSRQPNLADFVVQLTTDQNVCATVTLVSGDAASLRLLDAASAPVQGVSGTAQIPSAAACGIGVRNVELMCTGAVPCVAVWRVDAQ